MAGRGRTIPVAGRQEAAWTNKMSMRKGISEPRAKAHNQIFIIDKINNWMLQLYNGILYNSNSEQWLHTMEDSQ